MNGWIEGQKQGQIDGWTEGWMEGQKDGQTEIAFSRDSCCCCCGGDDVGVAASFIFYCAFYIFVLHYLRILFDAVLVLYVVSIVILCRVMLFTNEKN